LVAICIAMLDWSGLWNTGICGSIPRLLTGLSSIAMQIATKTAS